MGIERVDSNGKKAMSGDGTFSMLKSLFLLEDPDLIPVLPACIIGAGALYRALSGSARTFFLVQSSHTGTKVHGARSRPRVQLLPSQEVWQLL